MVVASRQHVKRIKVPARHSHKGENGVLLLIAGSKQYHGAGIFAGVAASKIVDLVYFCTEQENIPFVKRASPVFMVSPVKDWVKVVAKADAILVGPGLSPTKQNRKTINAILRDFSGVPTVIDATALKLISRELLHTNCILTPHKKEFKFLFKEKPAEQSLKKHSKEFGGIIVLKGAVDIICHNGTISYNKTGNQGMSKGGTGDILAGLIAALSCTNPLLLSCLAACYINGHAADQLKKRNGFFYNASDLLEEIPRVMNSL